MPFPAQAGLVPRRRKIANACDFCREHRVRCEAATPCPACVANEVPCVRSRPSHAPRRGNRVQRPEESARQQGESHLTGDRQIVEDASTSASTSPPPIPTPSSRLEWTSHKTDSILGFIARINAFCSKVPQQCPDTAPSSDPSINQTVPFLSGISHGTQVCDLSSAQIDRIMQIFWSRLRPLMPIVQWNEIIPSSKHSSTPFQPLKDAITVYTLHYISSSSLHSRLVGLDWPQFQPQPQPQQRNHLQQSTTLGHAYFQRALSAVTQLSTFAGPSLPVMQCYCYLTLYLLDSGQHQAAYVMVGLGLRIAQSLNYMDSRNGWYRECALFRHVWWTLVHLEFRCARHVGKPVTSCVDGLVGLGPSSSTNGSSSTDLQDVEHSTSSGLAYHVESIRLTAAALAVHRAMDRRGMAETTDIETRAGILSECLDALKRWRDELPRHEPFTNPHLDIEIFDTVDTDGAPPLGSSDVRNTRGDHTELQLELDQPPILTLQNTLLSLQYHNTMMTLHRTFIQFPSPSGNTSTNTNTTTPTPTSTPISTHHAKTALAHASAILTLTHARLSMHETHHGHAEIYQYAWNAVITIIGFTLAYPYPYPYPFCAAPSSSRCARPGARAYLNLDLALEVFASAREGSAARRAATLTRGLWGRVQGLVAGLQGQVQARASALAGQGFTMPGGPSAGSGSEEGVEIRGLGEESGFGVRDAAAPTSAAATGTSTTTTTTTLPCADGQPLWSWDDLSNLEAWPSCCDEVYAAFMVDPDPDPGPADMHAPQVLL
ncbi:hypothetical protein BJY01DRAFT_242486 [Aspergillus pseudoustus]|uniref:Zn(2)-C6 fungal-type domain-containing protein n=1 Tax=Aspergillus pseudoustus TaxID=1810923 RepID=A0ABR4L0N4_9EURO